MNCKKILNFGLALLISAGLIACNGSATASPTPVPEVAASATLPPVATETSSPTATWTDTPTAEAISDAALLPLILHPVPQISQQGGFAVYEYPLIPVDPDDADVPYRSFHDTFPGEMLPGIYPGYGNDETKLKEMLDDSNRILLPFDYRLELSDQTDRSSFSLFHGSELVKAGYLWGVPALNQSGSDFALVIGHPDAAWLIRNNSVEVLDVVANQLPPIFIQDALVLASYDGGAWFKKQGDEMLRLDTATCSDDDCDFGHIYTLRADGNVIYTTVVMYFSDNYLLGLWNWNGHWVLESPGLEGQGAITIDSQSLNDQFGYASTFMWSSFLGKPLYFFAKENQAGLVYDGDVLPTQYDHIVYEIPCCAAGRYNPRVLTDRVVFFARRGGMWYYVELRMEGSG